VLDEVKRLGKHTLVYGLGVWTTGAVSFFLVPVYTRYLSPSQYGVLELLNRSLQIAIMVMALGLRVTIIRFYYEHDDADYRRRMAGSATGLLLGLGGLAAAASLVISPAAAHLLLGSAGYAGLVRLMLLTCAAELALLTPLTLMQARTQSVAFTATRLSQFLLAIGLNLMLVAVMRRGLAGAMWATFVSAALPAVALTAYSLRREGLRLSREVTRQMLRFGLPLVPAGLLAFVINSADRYFLIAYVDTRAVGIYALGYKFGLLLSMLVLEPFMRIWTPFQMGVLQRKDAPRIFGRVLTYVLGAALWCGLAISVVAKDVVHAVSNPAYLDAHRVVPVVVLAYVFWGASLVFDGGIYISKQTAYKPILLGAAAALSVTLNVLLIPRMGMMGAAWAVLVSYAFFAALTWAVAQRLYPIPYEFDRVARLVVVAVGLYALSTLIAGPGAARVVARIAVAACLPLALGAVGFYRADELGVLRRVWRKARARGSAPAGLAGDELQGAPPRADGQW
jgi:O-antigen/teichoic acid export membrane protein